MTSDLSAFARQLADVSGAVIQQYFRTHVAIDDKQDGSPVTIADKKAEEVMREWIMRELPTHGIRGEEFPDHNPEAEYQWILDPIDGTKSFITGTPLFGTLIGLLQGGQPLLGVINNPILGEFLIGDGKEARLNGNLVRVRPCHRLEDATFLSSGHHYVGDYQNFAAYESVVKQAKIYRTWGDCHGYYLVATGYADVMVDPIMNPWDLLPVIPIIEGAGGMITDWQGKSAVTGTSSIATAGQLHPSLLAALNP